MQMINTFHDIVIGAGYKFGIYCGYYWYKTKLPEDAKKYDCWLAAYPSQDDGTMQERLKPSAGTGWQYSSKAKIPGITGSVDRNIFYKDYTTDIKNESEVEGAVKKTKAQIIQNIINDAIEFAVNIAMIMLMVTARGLEVCMRLMILNRLTVRVWRVQHITMHS